MPDAQTIVDLLPRNAPRAHMSNSTQAECKWHGGKRYALHLFRRWHKVPAKQRENVNSSNHLAQRKEGISIFYINLIINTFWAPMRQHEHCRFVGMGNARQVDNDP